MHKESILLLVKRLAIVVIIYQICRLLFYTFNANVLDTPTLYSFWGGLVFDLSAIGYINLLFIIAHLLPGKFKYKASYQKTLKIAFYSVNLLFIVTNFVDFQYFKFTGRRSSFSLITASGMENEIGGLLLSFLYEFWYLPLIFIGLSIVFWKSLGNLPQSSMTIQHSKSLLWKESGFLILFLACGFLMGRGGLGKKPLRIVDAIQYSKSNSSLVLNTPFSILKTIGKKESLVLANFFDAKTLPTIFNPVVTTSPASAPNKKNVVVIILESFGDENIKKGNTPFLDSLLSESLYFKNGFANGKLSIDAVPSTLSSIPSLMSTSFITSSYSLNEIYGLPKILKDNGYSTSFFHGAFNGSQNFDQYSQVAGFEKYYGKNEYVGPEAFDGKWGIFDEEFMQYFCKEISNFKQPFFTSLFTISSHNPYTIPNRYHGKFPKGDTKIIESIAYSDYALQQFFATAKKQEWYKNTLFIITADHTSSEPVLPKHKTNIGKFRIPIVFFDPSNPSLNEVSDKNFQQIDIMPSIIDYLNIKTTMVTFGKPFTSPKNFVVYYLDNIYHYINDDYYLAFDGNQSLGLYNFKKDELLQHNLLSSNKAKVAEMEQFIKAYIQSFNERVTANKLVEKI